MGEIKAGVDTLTVEVHGHGHDIHVARPLSIAEQSALYAISTRHHTKLCRRHSASAVIMGVQRNNQCLAPLYLITEPLDLVSINIRRGHLHGGRQIDDHGVLRRRRQHLVDGITHRDRKIHFGARKALRTVFEHPLRLGASIRRRLDQPRAIHRNIANTVAVEPKYILPLHRRGAVVKVHHGALHAF